MWNVDRIINFLGAGNAQLFRELKGRLSSKSIMLALGGSVIGQVVLLLNFISRLPENPPLEANGRSSQTYCVLETIKSSYSSGYYDQKVCQLNSLGQVITDWPHWWTDIFISLAWVLPLVLITGSVYFLTSDLKREDKRGTLNFLRLSPQSASEIFMGKLLGVPILVYIALMAAMPLHLVAAWSSDLGIFNALVWYLLMAALTVVFDLAAMLLTLASPAAPIGVTGIALWFSGSVLALPNWLWYLPKGRTRLLDPTDLLWFFIPVTHNISSFYLFCLGNCGLASYWLWQAICRRYLNPQSTLLAKRSSYQLNLCFQLWLVGFGLPLFTGSYDHQATSKDLMSFLGGVAIAQIIAAFVAIAVLTPVRQAVADWSRFRRASGRKNFWQQDIWQDLLLNDQSPSILALAVNLAIPLVVWLPWSIWAFTDPLMILKAIVAAVASALVLMNFGILAQIMMLFQKKHQLQKTIFLLALVVLLAFGSVMVFAVFGLQSIALAMTAVLSPFAIFSIGKLAFLEIFMGAVSQSLFLVFVASRLRRQVTKIGQSEMQAALSAT